VLAFAYTPRTSTILRVSTDNAGTLGAFDTIAFAQDRCVAAGATSLGCSDDLGSATRTRASTFVTPRVTAGSTVFLFVGGFEPPISAAFTSVGAFELSVSEAPLVPAGSVCDPAGVTSACAVGSSCRVVGRATYCVVDGAPDGACSAAAPRCDGALVCSGSSVCQAASGASGGACRTTGTPCDTGLACSSTTLRCRASVADGGACDALGATSACVAPSQCGGGVCRRWWVESALPAPAFVDACTIGTHVMLNGTSRDDARSAAAVVIPWSFSFFGSPQTQFWPSTNGFIQFGATPPSNGGGGRGAIPDVGQGPMVGLYWSDLVLRPAASDICVATVGTAPDRRSVVEWLDAYRYGSADSHLTMELVLNERGGAIDLIYSRLEAPAGASTVVDGSNAAIGLQSAAGELFVTHAGTVSTAAGIRFTPVP